MDAQRVPGTEEAAAAGARSVPEFLALMQALVAIALRSVDVAAPSVTLPQFRALLVLTRLGPCNGGELAAQLGVHPYSVTRIFDRLVHLGHATRTPHAEDRRQVVLDVSTAGRELVAAVQQHRERDLRSVLEAVPAKARSQFAEALPPLLEALDQEQGALPRGWAH